jgi:hypothetical protein
VTVTFLYSFAQPNIQEAFEVNTVPADDPNWLSHLAQHVEHDDPVMFEGPCMTDDAVDLVRKVRVLHQPGSFILMESPSFYKKAQMLAYPT